MSETLFVLKHGSRLQGMLPKRSVAIPIIGMENREIRPLVALYLLKRQPGVVTPALVRVLEMSIGSFRPYHLRHCFGQHTPVLLTGFDSLFSLFLLIDVSAGAKI